MDYTIEKKVRPLYEAIDDGQNKQALQLANKLLKKNPDWPLVKALKALVLVRTDKDNEAAELCVQVKKTIPTDQATLLALTLAYQELGQNSAIVELYENAANQQPKNEEFANKWFMAMVRNGDHKGQQAAALKLHRTFKNDKYLFWAIMSLALQGKTSALSYTLAERMMAKAQEEGRLEEVEHLRLYLLILMDQKKHADALQLLDSSLGQKSLRDPEVRQIRAELLQENGKWDQLLQVAEHALVEENADDWISWIQYFDALAATSTDYEKGYALVERLKKAALDAPMLKRGPFLAELELDYRLIKLQKDQTAALGHIVSYFERFGSKSCCFEDIQTYIDVLKGDHPAATAFIQSLSNTLKESDEKSIRIKNVYKRVNIRKIERYLGLQSRLTIDEGVTLVNSLWKEYQDALPLGEDLEKTESQHGDEFALLACHVLVDLYREHKHIELLLQAISLLESALAKSIYNFHIKLSLVRLYSMIGVFNRPIQIYKTMDIKQIQFDTMIHYFTDRFISLGCYDDIESVLLESLRIYKSNDIETPEMIVKAYQYGTFSKIQEFIEFRSRLYHSLQHAISKIELARADAARSSFQIKYAMQCFQELDVSSIKCDDASIAQQSDNRDFKVFMNCNPKDQPKAEELMKPTKSTNKTWLQLFSYVLNILKSTCSSTKGGADIESMVKAFSQFLARDSMKDEVMPEEITLAKCVFELVSAYVLVKDQTTRKDNSDEAIKHLQNASGIIEKEVAPKSSFEEATISWQQFHQVSIALETLNYVAVLAEVIGKAVGLSNKEAKKKAAESKADDMTIGLLNVQTALKDALLKTQTIAQSGGHLFKPQLQKSLVKRVIGSEKLLLDHFKAKDAQSNLTDNLKMMTSSWSSSSARLLEEVNRRVLKLH